MCGIAGYWRRSWSGCGRGAGTARAAGRSGTGASRAGRRRRMGRCPGRTGARTPAAGDRRPFADRLPADGLVLRTLCHHLQWRGVQFSRASRGARGEWSALPRDVRYRGDARRLCSLGRRRHDPAADWDVRPRTLGPQGSDPLAGTRSARDQATLLSRDRRRRAVRLGAQGTAGDAGLEARNRSDCYGAVSRARLCPPSAHDL